MPQEYCESTTSSSTVSNLSGCKILCKHVRQSEGQSAKGVVRLPGRFRCHGELFAELAVLETTQFIFIIHETRLLANTGNRMNGHRPASSSQGSPLNLGSYTFETQALCTICSVMFVLPGFENDSMVIRKTWLQAAPVEK